MRSSVDSLLSLERFSPFYTSGVDYFFFLYMEKIARKIARQCVRASIRRIDDSSFLLQPLLPVTDLVDIVQNYVGTYHFDRERFEHSLYRSIMGLHIRFIYLTDDTREARIMYEALHEAHEAFREYFSTVRSHTKQTSLLSLPTLHGCVRPYCFETGLCICTLPLTMDFLMRDYDRLEFERRRKRRKLYR